MEHSRWIPELVPTWGTQSPGSPGSAYELRGHPCHSCRWVMMPRASLGTSQPSQTGLCKELVRLYLFRLSSLLCYTQISSLMMNYPRLFFFAIFGSGAYEKCDCTQCTWMDIYPSSVAGKWNRFPFFKWGLKREEAVDDSIIQMLDDVVLLIFFLIGLFHWAVSGFSGIFKFKFWNFCSKL